MSMQLSVLTADNLQGAPLPADGLVALRVKIGNQYFTLSEKDGALSVKVDGDLVIRPTGSNGVTLTLER